MAHRGQRSNLARQERVAKRFIYEQAFVDREAGEIICLVERIDVLSALAKVFEDPQPGSIPETLLRGLVLADGYGSGAFQPMNPNSATIQTALLALRDTSINELHGGDTTS